MACTYHLGEEVFLSIQYVHFYVWLTQCFYTKCVGRIVLEENSRLKIMLNWTKAKIIKESSLNTNWCRCGQFQWSELISLSGETVSTSLKQLILHQASRDLFLAGWSTSGHVYCPLICWMFTNGLNTSKVCPHNVSLMTKTIICVIHRAVHDT